MSRYDLSFVADQEGLIEMPLVFNGKTTGIPALAQRITTLLLSEIDNPTKNYGTELPSLMRGANNREQYIENVVTQALADVQQVIEEEQQLGLRSNDTKLKYLSVIEVTSNSPTELTVSVQAETLTDSFTFEVDLGGIFK